jgi:hypothetical protein
MLRIIKNAGKFLATFAIVVGVTFSVWISVAPEDARDTLLALVTTPASVTAEVAPAPPPAPGGQALVKPRLTTEVRSDAGAANPRKRRISLRLPFARYELQWEVDR